MAHSRRAAQEDSPPDEVILGDRRRYKVCVHRAFSRARLKLNGSVYSAADALFHEFLEMWRDGASTRDLFNRWNYKLLGGDGPRSVGLRQVHLRRERALFIILVENDKIWLLDVFTKTSESVQEAHIKRAVAHARDIREGRNV
jgi:hypothetical protein